MGSHCFTYLRQLASKLRYKYEYVDRRPFSGSWQCTEYTRVSVS